MSTTCVSYAEKQVDKRKITCMRNPFPMKNQTFMAWLGLERVNFKAIPPIGTLEPITGLNERGSAVTFCYPIELFLNFDYDQEFEDRESLNSVEGARSRLKANQKGLMRTYREVLGREWFVNLEKLKASEATHISFYFV